jgi:hypothetical protein
MTTATRIDEISSLQLPNFWPLSLDGTMVQEVPNIAPSRVLDTTKGHEKLIQLKISKNQVPTNLATDSLVMGTKGRRNSPAAIETNVEIQAWLSKGARIHFIRTRGTETSPFELHHDRAEFTQSAGWSNLIGLSDADVKLVTPLPEGVQRFIAGTKDRQPIHSVRETAIQIAKAAVESTIDPEFFIDSDGSLYYDLRLRTGDRVMGELTIDGEQEAGFYDDSSVDEEATEVRYLTQTSAKELIQYLR